jgi:cysteinyl-tRNA synthetase
MHNGLMQFSGEKMSRSVGNLVSLKDFVEGNEPDVLRMMVLNSSYRRPLTFGEDVVEAAARGLERLRSGLRPALPGAQGASKEEVAALAKLAEDTRTGFIQAMDDDFNTAGALGLLFELVRQINQAREDNATDQQIQGAQAILNELGNVFGLRLKRKDKEVSPELFKKIFEELSKELTVGKVGSIQLPDFGSNHLTSAELIESLLSVRVNLREQKLWKLSDRVRDSLAELGVVVEDSAGGSSWRWE